MSTAQRTVLVQAGIGLLATGAFFLVGRTAGISAFLATGCVLFPTMYYAWVQARTLVAARILAHGVLKMLLTVTLMGVCIVVIGIEPLGFFATFAVMQLGYLGGEPPRKEASKQVGG
ncbi:MAG: F0F1-type ATP synthase assembly protein I [Candidatus Azotimanducaceae bacterium]|jgi:F0F1-type ATP synthase assembly protein I